MNRAFRAVSVDDAPAFGLGSGQRTVQVCSLGFVTVHFACRTSGGDEVAVEHQRQVGNQGAARGLGVDAVPAINRFGIGDLAQR